MCEPGLGEEDFPGFPAEDCPEVLPDVSRHHSSLTDVLKQEPDLYARLRSQRTALGVSLARCIKVGMDNRGHPMVKTIGIVAGDEDCYEVFRDLFDPVMARHLDAPSFRICDSHTTNLATEGLCLEPADPSGRFVLSSQVRVSRSLRGVRFPPAMSLADRKEVENVSVRALEGFDGPLRGEYFPLAGSQSHAKKLGGMGPEDQARLLKSELLFEAPDSTLRLCTGAGRHWPEGRGVFVSGSATFAAWINEQEHLRLVDTQPGDRLQDAFVELVGAADRLAAAIRGNGTERYGSQAFAWSKRLGYLTSNPANLGSAMHISIMIKLPCLGSLEAECTTPAWRAWCAKQRVQVRSASSEFGLPVQGLYEVSNTDRLGLSEVQTVSLVNEVVRRIVQMELRKEAGKGFEDLMETPAVELPTSAAVQNTTLQRVVSKARATLLYGLKSDLLAPAIGPSQACKPMPIPGRPRKSEAVEPPPIPTKYCVDKNADSLTPISQDFCWEVEESNQNVMSFDLNEGAFEQEHLHIDDLKDKLHTRITDALYSGELEQVMASALDSDRINEGEECIEDLRNKVFMQMSTAIDDGSIDEIIENCRTPSRAPSKNPDLPESKWRNGGTRTDRGSIAFNAPPVLSKTASSGLQTVDIVEEEDEEVIAPSVSAAMPIAAPVDSSDAPRTAKAAISEKKIREEEVRIRAQNTLRQAALSSNLDRALMEVHEGRQPAVPSTPAAARETPTTQNAPAEVREECQVAMLSTPVALVAKETPTPQAPQKDKRDMIGDKPALAWALEALSQRDKRVGELLAMISAAKRKLSERDETCQQIQEKIGSARLDLAHLELDVEWHRRAHETAKEKSCELDAGHHKLLAELDGQNQKLKHAKIDAQESCLMSAGSGNSTATGGATASSAGCFTPLNMHNSLPFSPSPLSPRY